MKNRILLTITALSNIVFVADAAYLLDERYYGSNGWQTALTGLISSAAWICLFTYANPRPVERFFKQILQKGADIYARYRNKIKRVYRKNYE